MFLFGGERVYRHFFSQNKSVESYRSKDIEIKLGEEGGRERGRGKEGGRKQGEERGGKGRRKGRTVGKTHPLTATLIHPLIPHRPDS